MLVEAPCGLFSRPVQEHRMDDIQIDDVDRKTDEPTDGQHLEREPTR